MYITQDGPDDVLNGQDDPQNDPDDSQNGPTNSSHKVLCKYNYTHSAQCFFVMILRTYQKIVFIEMQKITLFLSQYLTQGFYSK